MVNYFHLKSSSYFLPYNCCAYRNRLIIALVCSTFLGSLLPLTTSAFASTFPRLHRSYSVAGALVPLKFEMLLLFIQDINFVRALGHSSLLVDLWTDVS